MNREIKFRGLYRNVIVYGNLIHGVGSKSGKMYILPNVINLATLSGCDPLDGYEVSPGTVGQYTGLKDKNGVEIYEGDILSDGYRNRKVRWQETIAGWGMSFAKGGTVSIEKDVEVVGNIYQNPELL